MANTDAAFGLRPVKSLNGHPWTGAAWKCWHSSTNSSAIYLGDPVKPLGNACSNGCCIEIIPSGTGDGSSWMGCLVGVEPLTTSFGATSTIYVAASTSRFCNVVADPNMVFEMQADDSNAITDVLANALFVAGTGSTITGLSGFEMDSTIGQDATYPLLIIGAVDREDNDISAANAKWLVLNNLHSFKAIDADTAESVVGTVGV